MGHQQAREMAELTDLETGLTWHLRNNHYPPVPLTMVAVCRDVIEWVRESADTDKMFALPNPITWRGQNSAPAWAIIEGHHLEAWLEDED